MENKEENLEIARKAAKTLAEFVLGQIEPKMPDDLEGTASWHNDIKRLEKGIKKLDEDKSEDYVNNLTNLATGLLIIYRNIPYLEK
jgi:hypothetical protein